MTRLCAIGTSQLGCLKAGWDQLRDAHPGHSVTFFGAPNSGLEERLANVRLQDGAIVPTAADVQGYFRLTSGGQAAIELAAYDAFLVIGCGIGPMPLVELYATHRSDEQAFGAAHTLLTPACYQAAVRQCFEASLASRLAAMLCEAGKPVLLTPDPRPSIQVLQAPPTGNTIWDHSIRLLREVHANGDQGRLDTAMREAMVTLARPGLSIFGAAGAMCEQSLFTPHAFCEGSPWLQNGRFEVSPREDFFHMNGRYGAEILGATLRSLGQDGPLAQAG